MAKEEAKNKDNGKSIKKFIIGGVALLVVVAIVVIVVLLSG